MAKAKLTLEQKEEIKKIYKEGGHSLKELANRYGCSVKLVWLIVGDGRYETHKEQSKKYSAINRKITDTVCHNCGRTNLPNARFCSYCGYKLKDENHNN